MKMLKEEQNKYEITPQGLVPTTLHKLSTYLNYDHNFA